MTRLLLFVALQISAGAQVYTVNITAAGNYGSVPTVTASGGGCSSEPTFAATLATGGGLQAIAPTFVGTGCTSVPALAIAGSGGGAATAVLLPASIVLLSTVPSLSGQALVVSSSGTYNAWLFECILSVPASRVPFYAARLYPLAGTAQAAVYLTPPSGLSAALVSGVLSVFDDMVILNSSESTATIEAAISASCTSQQAAINAWNPWAHYGSTYLNGTWTITNVQ